MGHSQVICEAKQGVMTSDATICNQDEWLLVFADEFNDNSLDLSRWEVRGWSQGELYTSPTCEYNTLDNAIVSNGTLRIIAKKDGNMRRSVSWKDDDVILDDGFPNLRYYEYTSSNIWTKNKFEYGKFEARIKIPKGKGFWPAFWTFAGDPWNEIDIFEFWTEENSDNIGKIHHMNHHYDDDNNGESTDCPRPYKGPDFSLDFHVFTLIWERNKTEWYVDGVLKRVDYMYYTELMQPITCYLSKYQPIVVNKVYAKDPMHLILNLAVQRGQEAPDDNSLPAQMEIDWIRYYKRGKENQNLNISSAEQLPLKSNVFNGLNGENVNINCDYIISDGKQLDVIAGTSVTLSPGFGVDIGASFLANVSSKVLPKSETEEFFIDEKEKLEKIEVKLYPNPVKSILMIDFGTEFSSDYSIKITRTDGDIVYANNKPEGSSIEVIIDGLNKGIYIVSFFNKINMSVKTHSFIVQ